MSRWLAALGAFVLFIFGVSIFKRDTGQPRLEPPLIPLPSPASEEVVSVAWSAIAEESQYENFQIENTAWFVNGAGRAGLLAEISRGQSKEYWAVFTVWSERGVLSSEGAERLK